MAKNQNLSNEEKIQALKFYCSTSRKEYIIKYLSLCYRSKRIIKTYWFDFWLAELNLFLLTFDLERFKKKIILIQEFIEPNNNLYHFIKFIQNSNIKNISNLSLSQEFNLYRHDGKLLNKINLLDQKMISGSSHPNETYWDLKNKTLEILSDKNITTTKFSISLSDGLNQILFGFFMDKKVVHLLSRKEVIKEQLKNSKKLIESKRNFIIFGCDHGESRTISNIFNNIEIVNCVTLDELQYSIINNKDFDFIKLVKDTFQSQYSIKGKILSNIKNNIIVCDYVNLRIEELKELISLKDINLIILNKNDFLYQYYLSKKTHTNIIFNLEEYYNFIENKKKQLKIFQEEKNLINKFKYFDLSYDSFEDDLSRIIKYICGKSFPIKKKFIQKRINYLQKFKNKEDINIDL